MFRNMRRIKQLLSEEESVSILQKGTNGVLALLGAEAAELWQWSEEYRRIFLYVL